MFFETQLVYIGYFKSLISAVTVQLACLFTRLCCGFKIGLSYLPRTAVDHIFIAACAVKH